jgi:radical SAM protein (TIGR01212 family)
MSESPSRTSNSEFRTGGFRYNAYGPFIRQKFGCRVYKVSVDAGFSCPNRDGTVGIGGCTYCNNDSFRPDTATRLKPVSDQIKEGISYLKRRYGAEKFIVYLQPYTNTHAPLQALIPLYESAIAQPGVVGISIGTRPDCVDEEKLTWLQQLARDCFVTLEYGLQSINDRTLARINRGHDFQCWLDAMRRSRDRGIWLGAHIILGFPWESRDEMLGTAPALSGKGLNFLKLHHLHIVRGSAIEGEYRKDPFSLLGFEEYTDLVIDFLELLSPAIVVERLFGFAPEDQLVGPVWGKSKAEIRRHIEQRLVERDTYQGRLAVSGWWLAASKTL